MAQSLIITAPGTLSSTAGLKRVIKTMSGFPISGLTDLFLFADGAGTTPANSVAGRSAGSIIHPNATNNAFAWLSGGGGLQLSGTEAMVAPASEAAAAWSLALLTSVVASVGGTATERIGGLLGFQQFYGTPLRGAGLFLRGTTNWNTGTPDVFFQHRPGVAGALGTSENLLPSSGVFPIGKKLLVLMSYDGAGTLRSTIYDKSGAILATDDIATSNANLFTVSSVTFSTLNPSVGLSSATYAGGQQNVEAFARYDHQLSAEEIGLLLSAGATLGAARGRPW